MSNAGTMRPRGRFDVALMTGFFWAVVGVFVVSMLLFAYAVFTVDTLPATEHLLMIPLAAARIAVVAAFIGIFPAGVFAGVIGWCIYRAGVFSRWTYMVVGALSAFFTVAGFDFLMASLRGDRPALVAGTGDLFIYLVFYLLPVLVGAFGGYMGGRVIERGAARD